MAAVAAIACTSCKHNDEPEKPKTADATVYVALSNDILHYTDVTLTYTDAQGREERLQVNAEDLQYPSKGTEMYESLSFRLSTIAELGHYNLDSIMSVVRVLTIRQKGFTSWKTTAKMNFPVKTAAERPSGDQFLHVLTAAYKLSDGASGWYRFFDSEASISVLDNDQDVLHGWFDLHADTEAFSIEVHK